MINTKLFQHFKLLFPLLSFNVMGNAKVKTPINNKEGKKLQVIKKTPVKQSKTQFVINGKVLPTDQIIEFLTFVFKNGTLHMFLEQYEIMKKNINRMMEDMNDEQKDKFQSLGEMINNSKKEGLETIEKSPEHKIDGEKILKLAGENEFIAFFLYVILFSKNLFTLNPEYKEKFTIHGAKIGNTLKLNLEYYINNLMNKMKGEEEKDNEEHLKQQRQNDLALLQVVLLQIFSSLEELKILIENNPSLINEISSYHVVFEGKIYNILEVIDLLLNSLKSMGKNKADAEKFMQNIQIIMPLILHLARLANE